ncbi:MAG TPA: FMN-binding protein [Firmicutes bacterium]|nr:FMN-binding protein [Bacillota bacterium]
MKKGLILGVVLAILMFSFTVLAAEPVYKDGTYVGYSPDPKGDYIVEVVIQFGNIADVNIITPYKPADYKSEPSRNLYREYPIQVLKNQKAEIDVVTGATHSTHGYVEATKMALAIASGTYKGDVYYGVAKNYVHGHVVLAVTVKGDKVTDVKFLTKRTPNDGFLMEDKDDNYKNKPALEFYKDFPKMAIEAQTDLSKIDVVSGATHSYEQYKFAYEMALRQAGLIK